MNPEITLCQLTSSTSNGYGRLVAMTGAHTFVTHENGISFKFKGSRAANYAKITLEADDTYTMTIGKIRNYRLTKPQEFEGLYAESLRPAFERATGLYTSL